VKTEKAGNTEIPGNRQNRKKNGKPGNQEKTKNAEKWNKPGNQGKQTTGKAEQVVKLEKLQTRQNSVSVSVSTCV